MFRVLFTFWVLLALPFEGVCNTESNTELDYQWLDDMESEVSRSLLDSARWIDNWFIDEQQTDTKSPKGLMRVTTGWEPRRDEYNNFVHRVRLRLQLPNVKRRIAIVFSDHDPLRDNSPMASVTSHPIEKTTPFDFSLRWVIKDQENSWTHRLGVGRSAQLYGRSAYSLLLHADEDSLMRWRASLSWYSSDGWIGRNQLVHESKWSSNDLVRVENNTFYEVSDSRWLWQQGIYWFHQQDKHTAWQTGIYADGNLSPETKLDEYVVSVRRRKNALREWLYFDIEPFILWRRDENFKPSPGIALRVHGYFGN